MLALLATIALVIAGSPTVATAAACDPCPTDCPTMAPAGERQAAGPAVSQEPGQASEVPCTQTVLCQGAATAASPALTIGLALLSMAVAEHSGLSVLAARSWPPDPALRPPILS